MGNWGYITLLIGVITYNPIYNCQGVQLVANANGQGHFPILACQANGQLQRSGTKAFADSIGLLAVVLGVVFGVEVGGICIG